GQRGASVSARVLQRAGTDPHPDLVDHPALPRFAAGDGHSSRTRHADVLRAGGLAPGGRRQPAGPQHDPLDPGHRPVPGRVVLLGALTMPAAPAGPLETYHDRIVVTLVKCTIAWALLAMGVGVWLAAQLVWPALNFDLPWLSFGRLRPLHTNGVIFGF